MIEIDLLENRTFDELQVGDHASLSRRLMREDIELFALLAGDVDPARLDPDAAARGLIGGVMAHGLWGGGLISAALGTELPGPGTVYLDQTLTFLAPMRPGDLITVTVTVTEKNAEHGRVTLDCACRNQRGETVIAGAAQVEAPREKLQVSRAELPNVRIATHDRYRELMEKAKTDTAPTVAVVHPCSPAAIIAAIEAAEKGLIAPILVGPEARIRAAADKAGRDIGALRIVDAPHSHASADAAVALVQSGEALLMMKGSLHTEEMMGAVVRSGTGIRTERRISHCYLMDVPGYPRPLIITDAAVNIAPTLEEKADIIRNAIDLAHVIDVPEPKVAILAAVETVNPKMQSTLDAAALCKMADRGQITGGVLDGPLAFDNAVSENAAQEKHIGGPVAGRADILVVPDIEAGNMLAKQLSFFGQADAAGIVLGARVPIILTSRADSLRTRLASCAIAALVARAAPKAAPGPTVRL